MTVIQNLILAGTAVVLAGAAIGFGICVNILLEHWYNSHKSKGW